MAAPLLFRAIPLHRIRLQHHRIAAGFFTLNRWPSAKAPESTQLDDTLSYGDKHTTVHSAKDQAPESTQPDDTLSYGDKHTTVHSAKDPPKFLKWDDPDFRKWKDEEAEILGDILPITFLTKEILHSNRYMDGEHLTAEDEKAIVEKLLAYHPHSEDKIGCGLDSIMVDRHPQFKHSRCLFVVRTDGGWIDFSYQKCLRAYIRDKYPSYAERFIREHYKRSSG